MLRNLTPKCEIENSILQTGLEGLACGQDRNDILTSISRFVLLILESWAFGILRGPTRTHKSYTAGLKATIFDCVHLARMFRLNNAESRYHRIM